MFGYIRTYTPELRVREHEGYRAAYCGLCHEMGRCCGCTSRLTLSYDFVFLALVRLCVTGEMPTFRRRRCIVHPLRRRATMESSAALTHCARCAALLNYWKLRDDAADERGVKRLCARLLLPLFSGGRRRARRTYADLDAQIEKKLCALAALEGDATPSADLPANLFGELVRDFCAYGLEGAQAKIAGELGYHTGRWIYLVDALDDRETDAKSGAYNPFVLLYGAGELSEEERVALQDHLTAELMGVERALDLVEEGSYPDGVAILRNILYLGMPHVAKDILDNRSKTDEQP